MPRVRIGLVVCVYWFWATVLFAADPEIELYVWEPRRASVRLILPVARGQSPEEAARRYVALLRDTPEFTRPNETVPELGFARFYKLPLTPLRVGLDARFALVTSEFAQITPGSGKIESMIRLMKQYNADPFLIPLAVDQILTESQAQEFRRLVADSFPGMMVLGGYDIDPRTYGQDNRHARNFSRRVDQFQINLVQAYTDLGEGLLFGICRGHQLCAVARGSELIQDIRIETKSTVIHGRSKTGTDHKSADNWHLVEILPSQLSLWMNSASVAWVISRHHESVKPSASDPAKVVAVNNEGAPIVEAMEMRLKRRGWLISVQFHPEDAIAMPESESLFQSIVGFAATVQDGRVVAAQRKTRDSCTLLRLAY